MRIFALLQCTDYVRTSYMRVEVRREWHLLRLVQEKLFGVCSIQAAMPPLHHHPRPPSPSPKNTVVRDLSELSISECVRLCDAHMAYTYVWYITTFRITFLSVTHHVHTRTYIRILCENRSSIQSLSLMRSAISTQLCLFVCSLHSKRLDLSFG